MRVFIQLPSTFEKKKTEISILNVFPFLFIIMSVDEC